MRPYASRLHPRRQESPVIRDTLCRSDRQCGVSKSDGPELSRRLQSINDLGRVRDLLAQVSGTQIPPRQN